MKNLNKICCLILLTISCSKEEFHFPKAFHEIVIKKSEVLSFSSSEIILENEFILFHPSSQNQTIDVVNSFKNLKEEDISIKVKIGYNYDEGKPIYDEDYSCTIEEMEYIVPEPTEPVSVVFMMHPGLPVQMINGFMSNFDNQNEYLFSFFYRRPGSDLIDFTNQGVFSNARDENILAEIIQKKSELNLMHDDWVPMYDALDQMLEYLRQHQTQNKKHIVVNSTGDDDGSSVSIEQVIQKANEYQIPISFLYRVNYEHNLVIPQQTNGIYSFFYYHGQIENIFSIPVFYLSDLLQNKFGYYRLKLRMNDNLSRFEQDSMQYWNMRVNCIRDPQDYENGIAIDMSQDLVFQIK